MENEINNLIKTMRDSKMTPEEKTAVYFKIETFVHNNPVSSNFNSGIKRSPYFSRRHFFTAGEIIATSFLLVVFGFGGLSYSSASALPGELLYSLKINVKEKVEEKLVFTPQKKIDLRKKRIETRFTEAEVLIKENKITKENREIVEKNIKEEKVKIEKELVQIKATNPEIAVEMEAQIEDSIKVHQEKISTLIQEQIENKLAEDKIINSTETVSSLETIEKETKQNNTTSETDEISANQENTVNTNIETEINKINKEITTEAQKIEAMQNIKTESNLLIDNLKIITTSDTNGTLSSNQIDTNSADTQESE